MNNVRAGVLCAAVLAGAMTLSACSETGSSGGGTTIPGLSGASGNLVGEGASSQQNAMDYFAHRFQEASGGASLSYNASGSGSGRTNFVAGQVAFAGSDSPLKDDQVAAAKKRCGGNDAWHLPMVIGPVAIAYHLDGTDNLNLSVDTISKIFSGKITQWNDPAIAAENKGVELPDRKISVIYRSDESGTSDNFQKFLAANTDWSGEGQQFPTAVGAGANGSNGVATEVKNIDGAITYVEAGFAHQQGLGVANVDFGHGPVSPTKETVNSALDSLTFSGEGHNMVVDTKALYRMNQANTYPLVLTTYEIVCSAGYDEQTRNLVKDFLTVALNSQDDQLADLGYIPVAGSHHDRLVDAVNAIH
ncbi:phosphate ABC transporter substrate-binding protein PstS [Corynebacterium poyangense]|uniref:Phosphate-binding protein n=1 Tax=Corynebacterium poyangense TaxID=2684405 RepID=A0A7H0SQX6_9CORY|nr:phosphate ABC transporter substrate-binding protein PstS [Corynebacterium poyangense]MBZ8176368.1 phosphate ABC transporter substrate-binding protein PstS [Corynebacterium poyangense]QNQ90951.1 phosphate ABC transporter substrate-binding protein PstS [Corynebacterium poyangense]